MMQIVHSIIQAQDTLMRKYPESEYNRVINLIRAKAGDDIEVLAYMADDKDLDASVRLFAVAAMGE